MAGFGVSRSRIVQAAREGPPASGPIGGNGLPTDGQSVDSQVKHLRAAAIAAFSEARSVRAWGAAEVK